jgi:hypothetical protein
LVTAVAEETSYVVGEEKGSNREAIAAGMRAPHVA